MKLDKKIRKRIYEAENTQIINNQQHLWKIVDIKEYEKQHYKFRLLDTT